MQAIKLSEEIIEKLDKVPSYTAIAALEICQLIIRERDTKASCSQFAQYLSQLTSKTESPDLNVSAAQVETASVS